MVDEKAHLDWDELNYYDGERWYNSSTSGSANPYIGDWRGLYCIPRTASKMNAKYASVWLCDKHYREAQKLGYLW